LAEVTRLGLPETIRACLFDLDGVLTETATLHAAAWKLAFDEFLTGWSERTGESFVSFDSHTDYLSYVDGKMRADGVRAFLASRGITLPEGSPNDPPTAETVQGLAARKQELVMELMKRKGVKAFEKSRRYVEEVAGAGLRRAVVSASANTEAVLAITGLAPLFEVIVDGRVAAREGLRGKPFPDTFLHAARLLDVKPAEAAVFEDALAGVRAGRRGHFGFVVGVDRTGQADDLRCEGADIVVKDLTELLDRQ
jgi:beta-phosphoglucomutase family hydrolase